MTGNGWSEPTETRDDQTEHEITSRRRSRRTFYQRSRCACRRVARGIRRLFSCSCCRPTLQFCDVACDEEVDLEALQQEIESEALNIFSANYIKEVIANALSIVLRESTIDQGHPEVNMQSSDEISVEQDHHQVNDQPLECDIDVSVVEFLSVLLTDAQSDSVPCESAAQQHHNGVLDNSFEDVQDDFDELVCNAREVVTAELRLHELAAGDVEDDVDEFVHHVLENAQEVVTAELGQDFLAFEIGQNGAADMAYTDNLLNKNGRFDGEELVLNDNVATIDKADAPAECQSIPLL